MDYQQAVMDLETARQVETARIEFQKATDYESIWKRQLEEQWHWIQNEEQYNLAMERHYISRSQKHQWSQRLNQVLYGSIIEQQQATPMQEDTIPTPRLDEERQPLKEQHINTCHFKEKLYRDGGCSMMDEDTSTGFSGQQQQQHSSDARVLQRLLRKRGFSDETTIAMIQSKRQQLASN